MAKRDSAEKDIVAKLLVSIVLIKLCLFFWGYINFDFDTQPDQNAWTIWDRWDSYWYQLVAHQGYSAGDLTPAQHAFASHFPPFYPMLMALVGLLLHIKLATAGLLISWVTGLISSWLLYQLVWHDFKEQRTAILAVIFFNIYPMAYFTISIYTESLFICLILLAFYLLRKEHILLPAFLGMAAVLTRYIGINIIPAYIFYLWKHGRKLPWYRHLLVILPSLGLGIEFLINKHYFGDMLFFVHEHVSNPASIQTPSFPPIPLKEAVSSLTILASNMWQLQWDQEFMMTLGWGSLFTFFALFVVIYGIYQRVPGDYSIYALSSILFYASFSWAISAPRFTLPLFPLFIVLATIKNRLILLTMGLLSILLLAYFTKIFIQAGWAF